MTVAERLRSFNRILATIVLVLATALLIRVGQLLLLPELWPGSLPSLPTATLHFQPIWLGWFGLVVVSIVPHEAGHWILAKVYGLAPRVSFPSFRLLKRGGILAVKVSTTNPPVILAGFLAQALFMLPISLLLGLGVEGLVLTLLPLVGGSVFDFRELWKRRRSPKGP